jgi:hypothetical protein
LSPATVQISQPTVPVLADPKPVKIEAPKVQQQEPIVVEQPQQQSPPIVAAVDSENLNNNNLSNSTQQQQIQPPTIQAQPIVEVKETKKEEIVEEPKKVVAAVVDSNDTNNNNYQKVNDEASTEDDASIVNNDKIDSDETDRSAIVTQESNLTAQAQDTNNNSQETDEKSQAPTAIEGLINYEDNQWSPANLSGKKFYTRDQLLKLKDLSAAPPVKLPDGVVNSLMKNNKEYLTNTLNQQMPPMSMNRMPFDAINSVTPKFIQNLPGGRVAYPKRPSQQGNKQPVRKIN